MNNELGGFAITLLAILAATIFNNSRFSELNSRIDKIQGELNSRMDKMQSDLSQFYTILGKHDGKIELLEKK